MGRTYVNVLPNLDEVKETVAPVKAAKPKAAPKAAPAAPKAKATAKADDLKKIEGIGPKTAEHFTNAGIVTFADLAAASQDQLQSILDAAGKRYAIINPEHILNASCPCRRR